MPGGVARRARERRLFQRQFEPLLPAVRAKEPAAREQDVVAVVAVRPPWTTRRLDPAVLVLDRTGARLWRGQLDGSASLYVEVGAGWSVGLDRAAVRLQREERRLDLWVPKGGDPHQDDRGVRHRVAATLERAPGPAPGVAPRATIDRVGGVPPKEVVISGALLAGVLGCAAVALAANLGVLWLGDPTVSLLAVLAVVVAASGLWLLRQRGRDGWVELYPDRVVHLQDRLVVLPWSVVRGFDDRPSGWVALDCDPPLAIPTVNEATRTAVLAALDAAGLARST